MCHWGRVEHSPDLATLWTGVWLPLFHRGSERCCLNPLTTPHCPEPQGQDRKNLKVQFRFCFSCRHLSASEWSGSGDQLGRGRYLCLGSYCSLAQVNISSCCILYSCFRSVFPPGLFCPILPYHVCWWLRPTCHHHGFCASPFRHPCPLGSSDPS